jgi:3,4-dihydroxy 2-butanone 4-phosphate synthase / GTP cyclohydrolase II
MRGPANNTTPMEFASVEQAVAEIARGNMVVAVGDMDRYAESYLVMAAEAVTSEALSFMRRRGGGWIGLALTRERFDELRLRPAAAKADIERRGRFTATIDARDGITTGVSVRDQVHTIRTAADPANNFRDLVTGGHVQVLESRPGGVLDRASHAEASVDLAHLAGVAPAGLICAIENADGSIARPQDLGDFCRRHDLLSIAIADLITYRYRNDKLVERTVETTLPTRFGKFLAVGYQLPSDDDFVLALVRGEVHGRDDVLVGIHSHSLLGNVFHSLDYAPDEGIDASLEAIERHGEGVLIYLRTHDGGPSLRAELEPHDPDDSTRPPTCNEALDSRDYVISGQILIDLGVSSAVLLGGDRSSIRELESVGLPTVPAAGRRAGRSVPAAPSPREMSSPVSKRAARRAPSSAMGRVALVDRGRIGAER